MSEDIRKKESIIPISLTKEMKTSFLDYSMSVIVSRALPDVRDGLKPVHRRILYAMNDLGMHAGKAYKKSARIVGEVIGKYHPHGDSAVYGTMVRMAQEFSIRNMLVDGHGNFGSIDGDGAAAMRYTEARMSKISMELLRDINKNTVNFVDNYDGSEREPQVLPARFPNLLVNGSMGIAVGMTTNIPTHNLREVISGTLAIIDNPEITIMELMDHITGPDFPTGALILGRSGIRNAYTTGRGSIIMRAKTNIEEMKNGKKRIIVTEIPYQVNKARLVEKIAELVREKKLEGITDLRDESNRIGIRVVIELARDATAEVVVNNLFKHTALQSTFGVNMLALVDGRPIILTIKEVIEHYIKHQQEVVFRRTKFELKKAEDRAHILEGLKIALDNIDEIIKIIRYDGKPKENLIARYALTEVQAQAILDMRLKQITKLEGDKILSELNELLAQISEYRAILADDQRILGIIKEELQTISDKFGDERRSEIIDGAIGDIDDEDLIPQEEIIITVTNKGYIKRLNVDTYKVQNRGGKGIKGMKTKEEDFVEYLLTTSTHNYLLFFTNKGKVYRMKGYRIPEFGRTAKGIPVVNLLPMENDEYINTIIPIVAFDTDEYLFFATKKGVVKRTKLSEFERIRSSGKIALSLKDDDEVLGVRRTSGTEEIILASSEGKAIRFEESTIREMGRSAAGVRGMRIPEEHNLVGLTSTQGTTELLAITEFGYGKRTNIEEYRLQTRGGKGTKTISTTSKNGQLIGVRAIDESVKQDLFIITNEGIIIRLPIEQISQSGRATQGVRLIRLNEEQRAMTVSLVPRGDEEVFDEIADEIVEK
ncbi:DNA gyrase GyrA [Erysipelotrichaceae bacterium]|nr:DNA gyrase GyrA [Erysipelotrichaceae bacterium]